ncbi:outer membrane beta-barrel protein [Archangium violaceum]|nr:outer membrane beta-barrel protein [Archangium violaceum]
MKSVIRMGLCVAALWSGAALAGDDSWKQPYGGSGQAGQDEPRPVYRTVERGADTGLYVLLGGGTDGYTGQLAPELNPGFAYGATVGVKPSKILGLELGYSGGLNDIDLAGPGGAADGADIVRNGAQAAVTLGLTPTRLQPYVMGGIGIEHFNVRGAGQVFGFQDDTSGYVPAGVGLRYNIGRLLTADARVNYNIPFEQDFAPVDNNIGNGRYQALLQLGGTY